MKLIVKLSSMLEFTFNFRIVINQTTIGLAMDSLQIDKKVSKSVAVVSKTENYQRKLFTLLCLLWTQIAYTSLINPMVFTNPLLACSGVKSTEANYCENRDKCDYLNSFTGTHYAGLYCQKRDIRMGLQSIFAFGCIIGLLILPVISDSRGKKVAMNLCLFCMIAGDILVFCGIFYSLYLVIGVGQLLCAIGSVSLAVISYSINSDFFSDDLRQKAVIYYCAAWGLTDMSVLLVYYIVPYWMFFMVFLLFIPIVILYLYFRSIFLESPHYLIISQKKYGPAIEIIKKIAEHNGATQAEINESIQIINQIEKSQAVRESRKVEQTAKETLGVIFRTHKYIKAVVCLIFIKMAYYCFYFGVQGSLERTGFNFGVSVFLLGLGQFTGYMTGSKFVPKLKRKTVLLATNLLTASIGILYIKKTVEESPLLASVILYVSFILNSLNFSAITLVETQSFSSSIRSTAVGIVFSLAYLIRLVIPFVIGYLNERGIHTIIASSIFIVVLGVIPTLIVNQTYGFTNLEEPLVGKQLETISNTVQTFNKKQEF